MERIGITSIPFEIIEHILGSEVLTVVDVANFGSTCSSFCDLINKSNKIWKNKFMQMWPHLLRHECYKDHIVTDWLEELRQRMLIGRQTLKFVGTMSAKHIKHEEISPAGFKDFEEIFTRSSHKLALRFMIDELMLCVHHKQRHTNLTNKYYSEKILRHLRQLELTQKWEEFKNAPPEVQLLERGAVIIAQWSQPTEDITNDNIASELDAIAEESCKLILLEHGNKHPALCVPNDVRAYWKTHNIPDNHYSPYVSRQVILAVSTILFKEMGFYGNSELYYSYENSYINKVLQNRRGIPITLAILFESITRRLGVKCEPVSFPGHFLLRWRDSYKENVTAQYFYIDVFNGGVFLRKDSCPQFANVPGSRCPLGDIFRCGPSTARQVVERMANCLEVAGRQRTSIDGRAARLRSTLELLHLVNPMNLNSLLQLARFYMQYNMDVSSLLHTIHTNRNFDMRDLGQASYIIRTLKDYDDNFHKHLQESTEGLEVKKREGLQVEYAVGMLMHHRLFGYTCVIVGWDPICVASDEWMAQMNIKALSRQHRQPFYHVLVSDGTNRYAAEENLEVERECLANWVPHGDVGRYFDTFCETHYLPNPELLCGYPDDPPIVSKCLSLE